MKRIRGYVVLSIEVDITVADNASGTMRDLAIQQIEGALDAASVGRVMTAPSNALGHYAWELSETPYIQFNNPNQTRRLDEEDPS